MIRPRPRFHIAHLERANLAHAKPGVRGERDGDSEPVLRFVEELADVLVARRIGELLALTRERRDGGHLGDLAELDCRAQHGSNERQVRPRLNAARCNLRGVLTDGHHPGLVEPS
jgi:hypothetical protein